MFYPGAVSFEYENTICRLFLALVFLCSRFLADGQIVVGNQYQYCNVVSVHCEDTNGPPVMCINLLVPIFPSRPRVKSSKY